mmetsp:Transcript_23729/g.46741  ORF Transcript_23729/g.46741 Transcript_23729/m.46741 type:complete len:401 (-) Transcript_23729:97-1299(-)
MDRGEMCKAKQLPRSSPESNRSRDPAMVQKKLWRYQCFSEKRKQASKKPILADVSTFLILHGTVNTPKEMVIDVSEDATRRVGSNPMEFHRSRCEVPGSIASNICNNLSQCDEQGQQNYQEGQEECFKKAGGGCAVSTSVSQEPNSYNSNLKHLCPRDIQQPHHYQHHSPHQYGVSSPYQQQYHQHQYPLNHNSHEDHQHHQHQQQLSPSFLHCDPDTSHGSLSSHSNHLLCESFSESFTSNDSCALNSSVSTDGSTPDSPQLDSQQFHRHTHILHQYPNYHATPQQQYSPRMLMPPSMDTPSSSSSVDVIVPKVQGVQRIQLPVAYVINHDTPAPSYFSQQRETLHHCEPWQNTNPFQLSHLRNLAFQRTPVHLQPPGNLNLGSMNRAFRLLTPRELNS